MKKKNQLQEQAKSLFKTNGEAAFVQNMKSLINIENIGKVCDGFHGFPVETDEGYLVRLSGNEGSIHSPGYGGNFSLDQFMMFRDKEIHYKLDLDGAVMREEAVLRVMVNIDEEVQVDVDFGWNAKYVAFGEKLSWYKAEASCVSKGGHLASITSQEEQDEVQAEAEAKGLVGWTYWIGAKYGLDDEFQWADGSPWTGFSNWDGGREKSGGCVYAWDTWGVLPCEDLWPYVCEFHRQPARDLSLTSDMFGDSVNFWITVKDVPLETPQRREKMPGFRMSWRMEGLEVRAMEVEVGEVGMRVESPSWRQRREESLLGES